MNSERNEREQIIPEETQVLKEVFDQVKERNSSYSLRKFAKDLKVSHTLLSLIFSNRRRVSNRLLNRLSEYCRIHQIIEETEKATGTTHS